MAQNQDDTEDRVAEYSFKQTETDREISSKGELKKQTVKVYEVYPLPNREPVEKLISENGVPLSPERAAKEEKRVQEEFLKAEREKEKDAQQAARRRAEREKRAERRRMQGNKNKKDEEEDGNPAISLFLRAVILFRRGGRFSKDAKASFSTFVRARGSSRKHARRV